MLVKRKRRRSFRPRALDVAYCSCAAYHLLRLTCSGFRCQMLGSKERSSGNDGRCQHEFYQLVLRKCRYSDYCIDFTALMIACSIQVFFGMGMILSLRPFGLIFSVLFPILLMGKSCKSMFSLLRPWYLLAA